MRLWPVFIRDELNDEQNDALKCLAQSRPDALYVCSIKTAIDAGCRLQFHQLTLNHLSGEGAIPSDFSLGVGWGNRGAPASLRESSFFEHISLFSLKMYQLSLLAY